MFLSSYENKIDKKGRVSVPSSFRSFLTTQGYNGFVSYPSFSNSALECCTQERIEKLKNGTAKPYGFFSISTIEDASEFIGSCLFKDSIVKIYTLQSEVISAKIVNELIKFGNNNVY